LKQQSTDRHIILIQSKPVFTLLLNASCLAEKQTNTNCIVFGLTRSGLEPTIYLTRDEQAYTYTTDAVNKDCIRSCTKNMSIVLLIRLNLINLINFIFW